MFKWSEKLGETVPRKKAEVGFSLKSLAHFALANPEAVLTPRSIR